MGARSGGMNVPASLSPEANLRDNLSVDLYWDARRECEGRYRTLHLVRVNQDGDLTLDAAANSTSELRRFIECDHPGVRKRADLRHQKGQSLPDGLNPQPAIELDWLALTGKLESIGCARGIVGLAAPEIAETFSSVNANALERRNLCR